MYIDERDLAVRNRKLLGQLPGRGKEHGLRQSVAPDDHRLLELAGCEPVDDLRSLPRADRRQLSGQERVDGCRLSCRYAPRKRIPQGRAEASPDFFNLIREPRLAEMQSATHPRHNPAEVSGECL